MSVVNYKCPACGAGIGFDIASQKWSCKFCGSEYDEDTLRAGQPPEESEAPPPPNNPQDTYAEAVVFSCPSCGGQIIADENTAATFCVYCHNPAIIASRVSQEYRPAMLIPFQKQKDEVLAQLKRYCRRRPLLPPDFARYVEKGEVAGLYVPFWLFDAELRADMQAEGTRVKTWSDRKYRYTKTDYYAVRRVADAAFAHVPSDGSSRMDDKLMQQLEPFQYGALKEFDPAFLSGHLAERYDIDAGKCAQTALPRMKQAAEQCVRNTIHGYASLRVQSFSAQTKRLQNTYVMLPVWALMGEYKGKRYTFAMNGQTGKIAGNLPVSFRRAMLFLGATGLAAALLMFVGMMLL